MAEKQQVKSNTDGYVSTGIYKKYVGPGISPTEQPEEFKQCLDDLAEEDRYFGGLTPLQWCLNSIAWFKEVIHPYADGPYDLHSSSEEWKELARKNVDKKPTKTDLGEGPAWYFCKELPDSARDALSAIRRLHVIKMHLEENRGVTGRFLADICQVGRLYERVCVRPIEPFVLGATQAKHARQSGQKKSEATKKRQLEESKKRWIRELLEMKRGGSNYSNACEQVEFDLARTPDHVSLSTLRKHISRKEYEELK